ncbi:MAG TPA: septal ring lytic transglycosylase RlpA family protein [Proteiniphilum sp.]|nr:septal ring lytic transglycosylase RlpA family protein [Proteiniphilum sp.]
MFRITIFTALLLLSFLPLSGQAQQAEQVLGRASYYAGRFHGRKMSNGTSYHRDSLTCAHRTYPFGTLLEVTNPKNNKSVIVKVTDRGPYMRNRIIDVSHAAAQQLGMLKQGVIQVEIREHIPMRIFGK